MERTGTAMGAIAGKQADAHEWEPPTACHEHEILAARWRAALGYALARLTITDCHHPVPTLWLNGAPEIHWLPLPSAASLQTGETGAPPGVRAAANPDYEMYSHMWAERHETWRETVAQLGGVHPMSLTGDALAAIAATLASGWRLWDAPWEWYVAAWLEAARTRLRLTRFLPMPDTFPVRLPLPPPHMTGQYELTTSTPIQLQDLDPERVWAAFHEQFPDLHAVIPESSPPSAWQPATPVAWENIQRHMPFPLRRRYVRERHEGQEWLDWRQFPDPSTPERWQQWVLWMPGPLRSQPLPQNLQDALICPAGRFWQEPQTAAARREQVWNALAGWLRSRGRQTMDLQTLQSAPLWEPNPLRQEGIRLAGMRHETTWWEQYVTPCLTGEDLFLPNGEFAASHLLSTAVSRPSPLADGETESGRWALRRDRAVGFLLNHRLLHPAQRRPGKGHFEQLIECLADALKEPAEEPWYVEPLHENLAETLFQAWKDWLTTGLWNVVAERQCQRQLWACLDVAAQSRSVTLMDGRDIAQPPTWYPAPVLSPPLPQEGSVPPEARPLITRLTARLHGVAWAPPATPEDEPGARFHPRAGLPHLSDALWQPWTAGWPWKDPLPGPDTPQYRWMTETQRHWQQLLQSAAGVTLHEPIPTL